MPPKDHKALAMIFGLKPKGGEHEGHPEEEGEPDGGGDPDFDDAWHEYVEAMKGGDDAAACDAMKAMIDIRIHGGSGGEE